MSSKPNPFTPLEPDDDAELIRSLFDELSEIPPESRAAVLDAKLPPDSPLRERLMSLLQAHDEAGNFLAPVSVPRMEGLIAGKYLLLEPLGVGGMAEVYRAKVVGPAGFEKQVAVKRILPQFATNERFRQLFEREAVLSSGLNHPNIVQVYDFIRTQETYCLILEFVGGKALSYLISAAARKRVPMPVKAAVYIVQQAALGLDYAHRKRSDSTGETLGIIHRDVSPKNVMVSYEGDVKVLDFGIAKAKTQAGLTQGGGIKGTIGYMSPEQAHGGEIDGRSDLFSLGVILYELITGKRLFDGDNFMQILKQVQENRITDQLESLTCPAGLKALLCRALATREEDRYPSGAEMANDLQSFLVGQGSLYGARDLAHWLKVVLSEDREGDLTRSEVFDEMAKRSLPAVQNTRALQLERRPPLGPNVPLERRPVLLAGTDPGRRTPVDGVSWLLWTAVGVLFVGFSGLFWMKRVAQQETSRSAPVVEMRAPAVLPEPAASAAPPASVVQAEPLPDGVCEARVISQPAGAVLSVNGVSLGRTPATARVPCAKAVQLKVSAPRYHPFEEEVIVQEKNGEISISLEPAPFQP